MNTEQTGVLGHSKCVSYCVRNGMTPFLPYPDTSPKQDLISIDPKGKMLRFQVKSSKQRGPDGMWHFNTGSVVRTSRGVRTDALDASIVDYLFLSSPEFNLCIPTKKVKIPRQVKIGKKSKYLAFAVSC